MTDTKKENEPELSEEDKLLKEEVELLIGNILNKDNSTKMKNISLLKEKIIESIKELNSLPRPIKFIQPFYDELVKKLDVFEINIQQELSSVLSFCSISLSSNYQNDCLKLFMRTNRGDLFLYGQDYINSISGDLSDLYNLNIYNQDELKNLAKEIINFYIENRFEIKATDLLLEIDLIELIEDFVNENNLNRILEYLLESTKLSSDQYEYLKILEIVYKLYLKFKYKYKALVLAIKLNDMNKIKEVFSITENILEKKQLCFLLARQRIYLFENEEELFNIIGNERLSELYLKFASNLDILKPKTLDEIYKTKIDNPKQIDSALINTANSIVNAFVNLGTGKDTLMLNNNKPYINEVKEIGQLCASASIGLINLWDFDSCSENISDYLDIQDGYTKAGALIGLGISNSGIWNENDQALAIINDSLESKDNNTLLGAIYGLGLAYAGTAREDLMEILSKFINDENYPISVSATAALSLGLIFVSSCHEEVCNLIITTLMSFNEKRLEESYARYFAIGLALNFLGKQELSETVIETLQTIEYPLARYAELIVELVSYIGTGNVLKIQRIMRFLEQPTTKENAALQETALACLPFITIGEKTGQEMCLRMFHHLMQYSDKEVKRSIPILLAFLSVSNPQISITDYLLKLAYEEDEEMSKRALLALGLVGFGTNNSRISSYLRNLAVYYEKDLQHLYCIKISQGFLHSGKGTVTINPFYCNNYLYSKVGMAGLFIFANSMLDTKQLLIEKFNYLVYILTLSVYPKMMYLLNENLEPENILVRVGQSIDTVTLVGDPRKITGFQTFTTPVVIGYNDRAELANEEFECILKDSILENIVIVKPNENFKKDKK